MDIQTVTVVIAGISVIIGVINSILSNRKAEQQRQTEIETRQAELLMQVYDRWSAKDFRRDSFEILTRWSWDNTEDMWRRFGPAGNLDDIIKFTTQASFYTSVGVLVEQGLIDINLVDKQLHNNIVLNWEKLEPIITEWRNRLQPTVGTQSEPRLMYEYWERLYHRIQHIDQHATAINS